MFNFYMNIDDPKDFSGAFNITGVNEYNGAQMKLEGRSDQQIIPNKSSNVVKIKFNKPFPNGCKKVNLTGNVIVTLGNSQTLVFALDVITPQYMDKESFTIVGPTYDYAEFLFRVAYEAIGW